MKIKRMITLWLMLFFVSSFQETEDRKIYWNDDNQLKWSDFKGKPSAKSDITKSAATKVAIRYNISEDEDDVYIIIKSVFYQNLSWKKNDSLSVNLLRHEQGHFDLTEISTRKFRKTVTTTKFYKSGVSKDLKTLYDRVIIDWTEIQANYDKETNHSTNRAKQLEWNKKIQEELKRLEAYSNPEIKLNLSD
jgi:hypothetical protein